MLDAPPPPTVEVSPARDVIAVLERASMPTIAELAAPMLASRRRAHQPAHQRPASRARAIAHLTLKTIADGDRAQGDAAGQPPARVDRLLARRQAFRLHEPARPASSCGLARPRRARRRRSRRRSSMPSLGAPCAWVGEGAALLCRSSPADRGAGAGTRRRCRSGPNMQENRGKVGAGSTYEDMLASLARRGALRRITRPASSRSSTPALASARRSAQPAIFEAFAASPDGNFVLVARVQAAVLVAGALRRLPDQRGDRGIARARVVKALAELPVADTVPNGGVLPGPRDYRWQPGAAGDDRLGRSARRRRSEDQGAASRQGDDARRAVQRAADRAGAHGVALSSVDVDRCRRRAADRERSRRRAWTRTWVIDAPGAAPRKLWERSQEDRTANPGHAAARRARSGNSTIVHEVADAIYLTGDGVVARRRSAVPRSAQSQDAAEERVFQTDDQHLRTGRRVAVDDGSQILTRCETRTRAAERLHARSQGQRAGAR